MKMLNQTILTKLKCDEDSLVDYLDCVVKAQMSYIPGPRTPLITIANNTRPGQEDVLDKYCF